MEMTTPQREHRWLDRFIGDEGSLDAADRALTLETEGPSMAAPESKMARYRDVMEFKSNDHRVLTSHTLSEDGVWHQFMTVHYRRKK